MDKILIFGTGGQAKMTVDAVEKEGKFQIAGFIDNVMEKESKLLGYSVLGSDEEFPSIADKVPQGIIAIGDNFERQRLAEKIRAICPFFKFISVIHPDSSIGKNVIIGEGSTVLAGAVLGVNTKVGKLCIINTKASLDHDGILEDYVSLAPGVTIGGNTRVGELSGIMLGSSVVHNVSIGRNTVIGSGSLVLKDISDDVVAYGRPCQVVSTRSEGKPYLTSKMTQTFKS